MLSPLVVEDVGGGGGFIELLAPRIPAKTPSTPDGSCRDRALPVLYVSRRKLDSILSLRGGPVCCGFGTMFVSGSGSMAMDAPVGADLGEGNDDAVVGAPAAPPTCPSLVGGRGVIM